MLGSYKKFKIDALEIFIIFSIIQNKRRYVSWNLKKLEAMFL